MLSDIYIYEAVPEMVKVLPTTPLPPVAGLEGITAEAVKIGDLAIEGYTAQLICAMDVRMPYGAILTGEKVTDFEIYKMPVMFGIEIDVSKCPALPNKPSVNLPSRPCSTPYHGLQLYMDNRRRACYTPEVRVAFEKAMLKSLGIRRHRNKLFYMGVWYSVEGQMISTGMDVEPRKNRFITPRILGCGWTVLEY